MFRKVLIANRGEIAVRIIRTLRKMGIASVAVYSDADRFTLPVRLADEAVRLGPAPAAESYLNIDAVVAACRSSGAEAVHPGYGFLSENVTFARRVAEKGIAFIGPSPDNIEAFGLKHTAREVARAAGVPLLPGTGILDSLEEAMSAADTIGYPVMLKSTAGGGGIGMSLCADEAALRAAWEVVQRTARASFGDARVYLERYVAEARHVEVQIFGDGLGRVVAIGERDCSLQRRNQKVIEEAPAPFLPDATRVALHAAAVRLGQAVNYASAGTVEFLYDQGRDAFSFLEVNTRLQVEHGVTEAIYGIDLVEWMVRQAAGEDPIPATLPSPHGAAFEARIYAEMPHANFQPAAGRIVDLAFPETVRVDSFIEAGLEVTPFYDPLMAKVIVHGASRMAALEDFRRALVQSQIAGLETNLEYLHRISNLALSHDRPSLIRTLRDVTFHPDLVEVVAPGPLSSIQELPGRLGLWHVGVPPSGPMDDRSFRRANRLVGNADMAPALELTVSGPTLRFRAERIVALTGAHMTMTLDGTPVPHDTAIAVGAGSVLQIGGIEGPGQRSYLAVMGGFLAAPVLGSRATFALGGFGGHATGPLKAGDVLRFAPMRDRGQPLPAGPAAELTNDWTIGVVYGPHGAPDFFTEGDIATLFSSAYEVHFNSARTGVRLIGPAPQWARSDGGEAGLHPSNLHDNAYAIGAIDFTGDMPIILGPDGPSLGGFVCPAVVARDELWKVGQLRPGDVVRFLPLERRQDPVSGPAVQIPAAAGAAIVGGHHDGPVHVVYRRQGDDNLLVEYGNMTLDIALRMRVHLLMEEVKRAGMPGLIDLTPGIRSLQIHYDGAALSRTKLLGLLAEIESGLPDADDVVVPSRVVHLPLSWNDPDAQLAMRKYQDLVRPNAPWCPDNIEFIRRINGLPDIEAVKRTVLDASYLVLGLGDVYLGAPVATPLDPRHRLVTTKYNPARTWTPENAVGIGGAYMCIYGMEGPGGYQLVGRTVQVWNTWRTTSSFPPGKPWLLDFFDQIRFFAVTHDELAEARLAFPHGAYPVRIEETVFSYADYATGLAARAGPNAEFKATQQAAFEAERQRWRDAGLDSFVADDAAADAADNDIPAGHFGIASVVPGNVWKVLVEDGANVEPGQAVAIVESMKMEITVTAHAAGRVRDLRTAPGRYVRSGDIIAVVEEA